jgi:hypothetical protein
LGREILTGKHENRRKAGEEFFDRINKIYRMEGNGE